jgi:hypothetical protein
VILDRWTTVRVQEKKYRNFPKMILQKLLVIVTAVQVNSQKNCVFIYICLCLYLQCSISLALKLHTARCDMVGPANINVTELMFRSLKVSTTISNYEFHFCPTLNTCPAQLIVFNIIVHTLYIIKFSNITYIQGNHSALSSNFNMKVPLRSVQISY